MMQFKHSMLVRLCVAVFLLVITVYALVWALHYFTVPIKYDGPPHPLGDAPPFPGSTPDNIWWFVQVSDIHLTTINNPEKATRIRDFKIFCTQHLKVIQPTLVLATGDLTDGAPQASQNEGDWMSYQEVLMEAKLPYSLTWLDVRGNHDNFNVPKPQHPNNLYRKYSVLRKVGDSAFLYELQMKHGTYSFIHIDALLDIGVKRPLNFYGMLDETDMLDLQRLSESARLTPSNQTIFFGHYPSSLLLAPRGLKEIMKEGIAYLCGHLHDLDGNPGVKRMYVRQRYGSLELELEDWRRHRKFRVMAFDHDLLSFTDVEFGDWPIILVTNPKPARFLAPGHEPVDRIGHSTHIRMLIFSPNKIKSVRVEIDDLSLGSASMVDEGPLFILPWKPQQYSTGLHVITVKVMDVAGRYKTSSSEFSLDQSTPRQPFTSSFILMADSVTFFAACIFFMECFCVLLPMFFRRYAEKPQACVTKSPLLYGFLLLVHTDEIYFSLLTLALYPLIGPWFIGEVLSDTYGVIMLYGVFVNNTFVGDKFMMYFFVHDLVSFHIPLLLFCTLHLSRAFFYRSNQPADAKISSHPHSNQIKSRNKVVDVIQVVISLFLIKPIVMNSISRMSEMNHFFGTIAFVACPKYTWTFLVGMFIAVRCVLIGYRGQREKTIGETEQQQVIMEEL